jgi:hypothetical protein
MLKKIATLAAFAAVLGIGAANAYANTIAGRVTSFSPTSIAVFDREIVTFGMNGATTFTRLIVQKPWQADTVLTAKALAVGRYVIVHGDRGVANWVQVALDGPFYAGRGFIAIEPRAVVPPAFATEAARHRAEAAGLRAEPNAAESKRPGSPGTAVHCDRIADRLEKAAGVAYAAPVAAAAPVLQTSPKDILSEKELTNLIGNAKTPADHRKIARHYAEMAAKYDADAADHVAEASAYRKAPTASESKRPGGPDTAMHCDRLADLSRELAKTARELAASHEGMAK